MAKGTIVTQTTKPPFRFSATIPTAATGAKISDLIATAGIPATAKVLWFKILGLLPDGATSRAILTVATPRIVAGEYTTIAASDFTTHGEGVAVGTSYYEPAVGDCFSYVRAPGGDTAAVFVVGWE